jgi:hypothetical protein
MKNLLRKFSIAFSGSIFIYLICGCGWYVEYDQIRYLIMNPDVNSNHAWWNYYYYNSHKYYGEVTTGDKDEKQISAGWKKQLKLESSVEEIFQFIFEYDTAKKETYKAVENELKKNKEWKTFMDFARECEGGVYSPDPWQDMYTDSFVAIRRKLLDDGIKKLKKQKDKFWQKKYAFQVLKLSFYQNNEDIFRSVYSTYFGFRKEKTPVDWWATHYMSMIYERNGLVDSANFLHAQIFSNSDNKMHVSHSMFTDSNFTNQLHMAINDKEKANLYLLAGMKNYFNAVDYIHQTYTYNPKHPLLPLMLTREMNKVEDLFGTEDINSNYYSWGWGYYNEIGYDKASSVAIHLGSLYNEVKHMDVLKKTNPSFYHLLLADLAILTRDVKVARQSLDNITTKDSNIVFQKTIMNVMLLAIANDITKDNVQDKIGNDINYLLQKRFNQFWSQPILRSLFNYLGNAFEQKGQKHKTVLCSYIANSKLYGSGWDATDPYLVIRDMDDLNSNNTIESIISLFEKENKNALEKILLLPYPDSDYHWEILGTVYLRQNNLEKSREAFKHVPEDSWTFTFETNDELDENPFVLSHLKKYKSQLTYWNKTKIVDTLFQINSKPDKGFKEYQLLGNAWFNFSKFGNSWYMLDYFYHSDFLFQNEYSNMKSITAKVNRVALNNSITYYKKALPLAKNDEDKTEIIYMLAWCYYMLNNAKEYMVWAGKYEHMDNTELYRIESCTITPLYDEPDTLLYYWGRGY